MPLEEMCEAMKQTKAFFLEQLQSPNVSPRALNETPIDDTQESLPGFEDIFENQFNASIFKKSVHIFSHLDADGLSAASILARTLQRAKIGFQITILRQLENDYIIEIQKEIAAFNHFIIFSDFGTGQLDLLLKDLDEKDFLILDHHSPIHPDTQPTVNHVNPYFYGIDGSIEISGAGVCYYFACTMDEENTDLAPLALIGAVGDVQSKGDKGTFVGVNSQILEEAIKMGKIDPITDIAISRNRPITQAIAYSLPIQIPGLSNNEENVKIILESNNIKTTNELNEARTLADLTKFEKVALNKILVNYMVNEQQMTPDVFKRLVTTVFRLTDMDPKSPVADIREMSSLLNACGRSGHPSLGIGVLLGDPQALKEALEEGKSYRKNIAAAVEWAQSHLTEYDNIIFFYGGNSIDEKMIGTIASMLIRSDGKKAKPIIAYAESDGGTYKVSARATEEMINEGLDLAQIMREVCSDMAIENPGGGHPPAAGAKIPSARLKEFLDLVDKAVKNQFENSPKEDILEPDQEAPQ